MGIDSPLLRRPTEPPLVSRRGRLELLPLELLDWSDFEGLQWRILRDVEGLRDPLYYGDGGQTQYGLDLIALAADNTGVGLQSKRVRNFGPADISAAVALFRATDHPFDVSRFVIGVSREVRTRASVERFAKLRAELQEDVQLELWDRRALSLKLKGAPRIVVDYFGEDVARDFCDPFELGAIYVPPDSAAEVREAVARTPEVTTGAGELIAEANAQTAADPAAALELVIQAQRKLLDAGFAGHAAKHEPLRSSLLFAVERGSEATRRRLDQLWVALDQGQQAHAGLARSDIRSLAAQHTTPAGRQMSEQHLLVADKAIQLYENPLAYTPQVNELASGDSSDRARLAALAGEIALADENGEWLARHAQHLYALSNALPAGTAQDTLRLRLRLLIAEGSDDWAALLTEARSLRLGYTLGGLVLARYARHLALNQQFQAAESNWEEAAAFACLAEHWTDAARWTFSRRAFRTRWKPFATDEILAVQTALMARGPDATVLPQDEDALDYAYIQFANGRFRSAAIAAQRALRDAVTLSDWEGERRARRILADVLDASDEPVAAAHHLIRAGDNKRLEELGKKYSRQFLDAVSQLDARPYWVVAAAYRFVASQADLVPDDLVSTVADAVLRDLAAAAAGTLVDLPAFASSRYLSGIAALAGISERLSGDQAEQALAHFEAQPPVEPDRYRHHDENEAIIVAGIASTQPALAERALTHLVTLLGRSQTARTPLTVQAVRQGSAVAERLLRSQAAFGNEWAAEMLVSEHPEEATAADIAEAAARLEAPLEHAPGVFTFGSGQAALTDSLLVRTLPTRRQQLALRQLIARAADVHVTSGDRASYLLAASNLAPPSRRQDREELIAAVLALVESPPEYLADAMDQAASHPLGAFRVTGRADARAEAAHLAATLANTGGEKERVRAATLGLVGDSAVSEVWVTNALQQLGGAMAPDIGFLSGLDWALRSLAAILWASTTEPAPVGRRLAFDPDVRVRLTLASQLVERQVETSKASAQQERVSAAREETLTLLRSDPSYRVRTRAKA